MAPAPTEEIETRAPSTQPISVVRIATCIVVSAASRAAYRATTWSRNTSAIAVTMSANVSTPSMSRRAAGPLMSSALNA